MHDTKIHSLVKDVNSFKDEFAFCLGQLHETKKLLKAQKIALKKAEKAYREKRKPLDAALNRLYRKSLNFICIGNLLHVAISSNGYLCLSFLVDSIYHEKLLIECEQKSVQIVLRLKICRFTLRFGENWQS